MMGRHGLTRPMSHSFSTFEIFMESDKILLGGKRMQFYKNELSEMHLDSSKDDDVFISAGFNGYFNTIHALTP
jgi:hypothetical protein